MTITTITINSIDYTSYASVSEADEYLNIDPVRETSWEALDNEGKGKKLIAATRRLDLLTWQGDKTGGDDTQENQWPRTGVTYPDGADVSTTGVPQEIENATILLAGSIAISAKVADQGTSGTNTKKVKAGSAEVEFFRSQAGTPLQDATAFDLVQPFTEAASTSSALGPLATGTDGSSTFTDIDQWGRNQGFP